jgi:hypothetical protein
MSYMNHQTKGFWCHVSFLEACGAFACDCGDGLKCSDAFGGKCYRIPRELGNPCGFNQCGTWNDPAVPELKFQLYCPMGGVVDLGGGCSRSKPCAFLGGRDAELDLVRLKLEDRAIELSKLVKAAKETALTVAQLARAVYVQGARPKQAAKQVVWDAKVMALSENIVSGRVSVKKLNEFKIEINGLIAAAQRIAVDQDKTICGAIVKAVNDVANWFRDAANAIAQWVNDNKCKLIPLLSMAIGKLGDYVLNVASAGTTAAMQVQPWCFQTVPEFGGEVDIREMGLTLIKATACTITSTFGVKSSALDDLCNGKTVAVQVVRLILDFVCGKPVAALSSIVGLAVACTCC